MKRLPASRRKIISRRTLTTRSFVASLFVAALALTGCTPTGDDRTEGSEQSKKVDATRIDTISPSSGSLLGGETITFTGTGLTDVSSVVFGTSCRSLRRRRSTMRSAQ
jgi:hypothetical protein